MIMRCINSASACEKGGSMPAVAGGSVLLGLPAAPGCTTTGLAGSVCCAHATGPKSMVEHKRPQAHQKKAVEERPRGWRDACLAFTIGTQHRPGARAMATL